MAHVRPRDAASVMLVRPTSSGEVAVLMGRRSRRAAFVPDVFVFPGGRAEADDDRLEVLAPLAPGQAQRMEKAGAAMGRRLASAAIRETWEETGYTIGASAAEGDTIRADHGALHFAARAITPRDSPIRFHARFFMASGDAMTADPAGSGELTDLAWYRLSDARRLPIIDVTEFMLDQLQTLRTDHARVPLFGYRNGRPAVRWLTMA